MAVVRITWRLRRKKVASALWKQRSGRRDGRGDGEEGRVKPWAREKSRGLQGPCSAHHEIG